MEERKTRHPFSSLRPFALSSFRPFILSSFRPFPLSPESPLYDLIIIGAGPAGLSAAYAARKAELNYLVIERGCIVHTIYQFPTGLTFYSTPELISLGDVPMIVQSQKPTREEALNYYLKFVETQQLNIRTYEEVLSVTGQDGDFTIQSISQTTGEH